MRSRIFVAALCAAMMLLWTPRSFAADGPSTQPAPLDQSVGQMRISGAGLIDVIAQLKQATGHDILVNWDALQEARVTRDLPVTIDLSDLPLREALTRLLDHVGGMYTRLVYDVDQNTIVITTFEEESKNLVTRVYDVRSELKDEPAGKQKMAVLVRRIKGVAPLAWRSTGGYGSIDAVDGHLIVTQTPEIQQRIAAELNQPAAVQPK
jgi:hypothetical protein